MLTSDSSGENDIVPEGGFFEPGVLERIRENESPPVIIEDFFNENEVQELLEIERNFSTRMVDRDDSRKTSFGDRISEWPKRLRELAYEKTTDVLGDFDLPVGQFPGHFIVNRFPLKLHVDSGKDPRSVLFKNILLPLEVNRSFGDVYSILFKQRWYGPSAFFVSDVTKDNGGYDYILKDSNGIFIDVPDVRELVTCLEADKGKIVPFLNGNFRASKSEVKKLKALTTKKRHNVRTNKHIRNDIPIDNDVYQRYLSHQPQEDFQSLEIDRVVKWKPGMLLAWDRTVIHSASNFLKDGVTSKTAIGMFTTKPGAGLRSAQI